MDSDSPVVHKPFFPMLCVTMSTFLKMERLQPHGKLNDLGLLVSPGPSSKVHFVSHEWLSYYHPDPSGEKLRRMQDVFKGVIAGRGRDYFTQEDWGTFTQAHNDTWSSEQVFQRDALLDKISEEVFKQDVEEGLVWIDFVSIPQMVDTNADPVKTAVDQKSALKSLPYYMERRDFFWVLAPSAKHEQKKGTIDFSSWRERAWCRFEEWANVLSIHSMMPLIVTDKAQISTYHLRNFMFDNLGKPERAPCMGSFSCCARKHVVQVGNVKMRIPCDSQALVQVLNKMFNAKVRSLLEISPSTGYILCGIECVLYEGADAHSASLIPSVVARGELDTPESFAESVGFPMDARESANQELLQIAIWCFHNTMVHRLLSLRSEGEKKPKTSVAAVAFEVACAANNVEAAHAILDCGDIGPSTINTPTLLGSTCLCVAAENGSLEVVELLLLLRADVDLPKPPCSLDAGRTALHGASMNCHVDVCECLLSHQASVNASDVRGATPLNLCSTEIPLVIGNQLSSARHDTVRCLLDAKADPQTMFLQNECTDGPDDTDGMNPL